MSTSQGLIEPQPLSEEQLKAIVDAEIRAGMGEISGELSEQRADALDRYLGELDGREMEGRSEVHARDVLEVIEWIKPSLLRIFSTQNAIEVDPVGPEDELAAEQETDYLRWLFFKKQPGFMILYSWFTDALLQKAGIVKTFIEEYEDVTREQYEGLTDMELDMLLSDDGVEIAEQTTGVATDMQTGQPMQNHDVTISRTEDKQRIQIENVPPEEFVISRDARTIYPKDARFVGHFTSPTVSELLEKGYTWDQIRQMELGLNEAEWNEETIARRHLTDEQRWIEVDTTNVMMRTVKFTEAYIKADMDGDGVAEQLKVGRSGEFIEWEEVDDVPFDSLTPIPLTHKFFGLSVADILIDLQEIRTGLLRAYMDNAYQTINGTVYFNERVNVDDMLTSRPWGVRAVEGEGPVGDAVMHVPPSGLSAEAFSLDELVDKLKQQRIGDFQSQLDADVLKQANNGVVIEMIQESKAKVEMIARIFAETGVRELFRRLHKLARQIGTREEIVRIRNEWVPVHPAQWRERADFTIKVGLGTRNKQEMMVQAMQRFDLMERVGQSEYGPMVLPPDRVFNALVEFEEILDEANPQKFWQNPAEFEPPPEQPDPQMAATQALLQIEQMKDETKRLELQLKQQQEMNDDQLQMAKQQYEQQMTNAKMRVEGLKAERDMLKAQSDAVQGEAKMLRDTRIAETDAVLKQLELAMKDREATQQEMLEKYSIDMDAATKIMQSEAAQHSAEAKDAAQGASRSASASAQLLATLFDTISQLRDELNEPKDIQRDSDGKIVSIGRKRIAYDENGRPAKIG